MGGGGGWGSTGFLNVSTGKHHHTAQHSTAQHSTAQHRTAPHSTSTTQHSTAQQHSTHQHTLFVHHSYTARTPITPTTRAPLAHQSHRPPHLLPSVFGRNGINNQPLLRGIEYVDAELQRAHQHRQRPAAAKVLGRAQRVQLVAKLGRQLAYVVLLEAGVCQWVVQLAQRRRHPVLRSSSVLVCCKLCTVIVWGKKKRKEKKKKERKATFSVNLFDGAFSSSLPSWSDSSDDPSDSGGASGGASCDVRTQCTASVLAQEWIYLHRHLPPIPRSPAVGRLAGAFGSVAAIAPVPTDAAIRIRIRIRRRG